MLSMNDKIIIVLEIFQFIIIFFSKTILYSFILPDWKTNIMLQIPKRKYVNQFQREFSQYFKVFSYFFYVRTFQTETLFNFRYKELFQFLLIWKKSLIAIKKISRKTFLLYSRF